MVKRILALDSCGFSNVLRSSIENEIGYEVCAFKLVDLARNFLHAGEVCLAIVNPYRDFCGQNPSYVNFIRKDLLAINVPVLVFSRTSQKRIEGDTGLRLGEDYTAYLKKPASVDTFVESVRGLLGN